MPCKTKTTAVADKAAQPQFSAELLEQLIPGPVTPSELEGIFQQFKKSVLERALGAEMSHHLGYAPGQARPEGTPANHRNGKSAKTVPTDDGDTKQRAVRPQCHTVHYKTPLNVVGTVPTLADGRVLLCKRNIEPRWGKWTLPVGFMELDETTAEGAARETDEEAGAQIEMGPLFSLLNVRRVGQVHLFYRATLLSDQFNPGFETIEARLFTEDEIPWDELAFRTVRETLLRFFADRKADAFGLHCVDIE